MDQQKFEIDKKIEAFQTDLDFLKDKIHGTIGIFVGQIMSIIPQSKPNSDIAVAFCDELGAIYAAVDKLRFPGVRPKEKDRWVEPVEPIDPFQKYGPLPKIKPIERGEQFVSALHSIQDLAEVQEVELMVDTSKIIGVFPDLDIETGCKG